MSKEIELCWCCQQEAVDNFEDGSGRKICYECRAELQTRGSCSHCYCLEIDYSDYILTYKVCCKCMDSKIKYVEILRTNIKKTKMDRYISWLHKWIRTIQWRDKNEN